MMKNIGCSSPSNKLKFILFITCVCSFALPFVHAVRTSLRNCDGGLPVKLNELTISSGQNSILKIAVSIGKVVEEGAYAEVSVKLGMIKLLQTKFDVCEEVTKLNDPQLRCPFSPGDYEFTHSLPIIGQIPRANYAINVRLFDVGRNKLGCFNLHVDLLKK